MSATPPEIHPDTVDALLESVRDLLRAEESRADGINSRGSGLAGVVGIIVTLAGTVSATVGPRTLTATLGSGWKAVAILSFLLAVLSLVAATVVLFLGVLKPRGYRNIAMSEVSRYPFPEFISQEKVMVQGRTMRGLIDALASERDRNDRKAVWLSRAYVLVVSGIALSALEAGILGLRAGGTI